MNKSFPTVISLTALRGLAASAVLLASGCATYYPDSGYGSVYGAQSDDYYSGGSRPYYGGGYNDGYYNDGYYGPAYGPTTVYYQSFSPGYYYRQGYGYYAPAPRYRDRDHDHGRDDKNDRGWVNKGRELSGDNPGRDRPHDRDGRNDDRYDNRRDDRNGRPGYRPPEGSQPNQPNRDRGFVGKGRELESRAPPAQQQRQQPQAQTRPQPAPSNRQPRRDDDRGGWAGKARSLENDR